MYARALVIRMKSLIGSKSLILLGFFYLTTVSESVLKYEKP